MNYIFKKKGYAIPKYVPDDKSNKYKSNKKLKKYSRSTVLFVNPSFLFAAHIVNGNKK